MSRDRERILEQALKHELSAAGTAAGAPALRSLSEGGCLDAETLGAWTDGGLDPAAMAAAEAHVSSCDRCQTLVGTMVKSAPMAPGTLGTAGTFSFWKWWLAPIAAGATAVTLWMVIPEQQQIAEAPPAAKVGRAAVVEQQSPAATAQEPAAGFAAEPERRRAEPADTLAAGARDDRQQAKDLDERKNDARKEEKLTQQVRESAALADAAPPAAPAQRSPSAPAAAAMEAPAVGSLQKSARLDERVIEIPTLDPALGWRIVGDRLERSDNAGTTWSVKRQVAGDGLAAGSAPSNSVGWFVGRNGLVLLTVDSGATFTDVSLAEPLDLASVAAIDARNASVYSVAGRRFRTDDGGRTWRPF